MMASHLLLLAGLTLPVHFPTGWILQQYSPAPWKAGEQLVYNVSWIGIGVGQAILQVPMRKPYGDRPCYLIQALTRGNKFINSIYKVEDLMESWVDAHNLQPLRFNKILREGSYKKDEHVDFDWATRTATFHRRKWKEPGVVFKKLAEVPFPLSVHDPLSSIYYLRYLKFDLGDTVTLTVCTDKNTWEIRAKMLKKEKLKLRAGTFEAFYLEPEYKFEGLFKRRFEDKAGSLRVWIDSRTHIPLKMSVEVFVGKIAVELEKVTTIAAAQAAAVRDEE